MPRACWSDTQPMPHTPGATPNAPVTLAKIIATLGPASDSPEMIERLIEAGVSIFRFNFSHGSFESHAHRLKLVRDMSQTMGRTVACMGDLQGPKIRIGKVPGDGIEVPSGRVVAFRRNVTEAHEETDSQGETVCVLPTTFETLIDEVMPGQRVLINDGAIRMLAVGHGEDADELRCNVTVGGLITTGKGINLPESDIKAPAITERDWTCVDWAVKNDLDFLALSFVRTPDEVMELKARLASLCAAKHQSPIPVIAKIEKPQAVEHLPAIVQAADGIMVARGDLGVEMDIARVPVVQKQIINECEYWGKPCIVATQMLETMIDNATPTRAEASDVANAVFDGAGVVMLSGETAVGRHPALVVETMRRILLAAEERMRNLPPDSSPPLAHKKTQYLTAALAHGAWHVVTDVGAQVVVCWSQNGGTARYLSQNDFHLPIVAYSSDASATRRMSFLKGVLPICMPPPQSGTLADWNTRIDTDLLAMGIARQSDTIVVVAGKPLGQVKATNCIAVSIVGEENTGFRSGPTER
jgi:pyruvate kinase